MISVGKKISLSAELDQRRCLWKLQPNEKFGFNFFEKSWIKSFQRLFPCYSTVSRLKKSDASLPSRKCSCVSPGFASSSLMSRNMPHKSPAQEMGNAAFAVRSPPSAAKTVSSPEEMNAFLRRISSSNCLETGLSSKSFFGIPAVAMMRSRSHTAVPRCTPPCFWRFRSVLPRASICGR